MPGGNFMSSSHVKRPCRIIPILGACEMGYRRNDVIYICTRVKFCCCVFFLLQSTVVTVLVIAIGSEKPFICEINILAG